MSIDLILVLLSLVSSAFFAGMEQAYLSSNRLRIEVARSKGTLFGKVNSIFYKNQSTMIAMMLLGNNISLVVYGISFGKILIDESGGLWGLHSEVLVLIVQTILSTLLVLIAAEFIPKAIASINPNRILNIGSIPLLVVFIILYLPTQCVLLLSLFFLRITGSKLKSSEKVFSKIDLEHYVDDLHSRIAPEQEMMNEMTILRNALDFSNVKARDCMIPRTEIVAVEVDESIDSVLSLFISKGLSKILVFRNSLDNVIGYVHSFDFFKNPESIKQILKPISFVPNVLSGREVLEVFSKQSGNIAVVTDEYGGTAGIITIEDVIEEIFGDIEDEHDKDDWFELEISEGIYEFSARIDIDYINEKYHTQLPESDSYDTIGGLVINAVESIPEPLTEVLIDNTYKITILEVSDRKIEKVRIQIL